MKFSSFLKDFLIVCTLAALIVLWPQTYCSNCGHLIEPGLSATCPHCGDFYGKRIYRFWWLKQKDNKDNNNINKNKNL